MFTVADEDATGPVKRRQHFTICDSDNTNGRKAVEHAASIVARDFAHNDNLCANFLGFRKRKFCWCQIPARQNVG